MPSTKRQRPSNKILPVRRGAASVVALGAIGTAIFSMNGANAASNHAAKGVVVAAVNNARLGTILASGKTLYTLNKKDCTAKCLKYWPPLVLPIGVTKATAGNGVKAAKLGVVRVASGARQVTYAGKALYFFLDDTAAGQVRGNNLTDPWGTWSVVVTTKPASSPSTPVVTTVPPTTSVPVSGSSPTTTSSPTSPTSTTSPAPTTTTTMPKSVTTTTAPSGGGVAF